MDAFLRQYFCRMLPYVVWGLLSDPETKQQICTEFHFKHKVAQENNPKQHCAYNASIGEVEVSWVGRSHQGEFQASERPFLKSNMNST